MSEQEEYYRRKNQKHRNQNAIAFAIILWIVVILVIGSLVD